jgi:hypothetical protein
LGNGDGTFQAQTLYSIANSDNPYLTIADLNGDGKLDLAVANTAGSVSILLGNGDGTFQAPVPYPTGGYSATVIAADFNRDGILDLACGNYYDANVAILLGNGDGTFQSPTNYAAAAGARGLVAADFNQDGRLDIAVANQFVDSLSIFLQPFTGSTTTTLLSSLNPSIYGQKVIFTATVTTSGPLPPTGTVAFTWGDVYRRYTIGTAMLNSSGVATLVKSNLNADTFPLSAVYKGDANNLRSTSPVLNQVVIQATSSATLTSSPNPSALGQAVTFTATISSPTVIPRGPVTFTAGKTVLGTAQLGGGKAKLTISSLAVGWTKVTATYYGNSNIAKSSASITQTVH